MKKVIGLILVCGFALAFLACGGGKKAEEAKAKAKADSTRMADSVAMVAQQAAAKAKADSTTAANAAKAKADSIANAAAKTAKKGGKKK